MSSEEAAEPDRAGIAPRRLHPAGIAVLGVGSLRELALPLGIAFVATIFGGGGGQPMTRALVYAVIGAVVAMVAGYVRWATTRWSVGDGTIRLRTGVLSEKETDIPLGRVQAIDTVHGPLQRLFGVRGVQVQTAGGGKEGEISLPAVSPEDVELLRAALSRRGAPAAAERAPLVQRRLGARRLLVAALTAGQVGVLLPLLAVLPQLARGAVGQRPAERRPRGPADRPGRRRASGSSAAPGSCCSPGCSPPPAPCSPSPASRSRATRTACASPAGCSPAARRRCRSRASRRCGSSRACCAGRSGSRPCARRSRATRRRPPRPRRCSRCCGAARSSPSSPSSCPSWPTGSTTCTARPAARCGAISSRPPRCWLALGAAACVAVPSAAPWPLLAALPAAALGAARWRAAGWRIEDRRVAVRFRRLARTTVLAPAARLQQHGVRQTVLQRRAQLADVDVRVGAGTRGLVRHLDARVAGGVFDALRREEPENVARRAEPAPPSARSAPRR